MKYETKKGHHARMHWFFPRKGVWLFFISTCLKFRLSKDSGNESVRFLLSFLLFYLKNYKIFKVFKIQKEKRGKDGALISETPLIDPAVEALKGGGLCGQGVESSKAFTILGVF